MNDLLIYGIVLLAGIVIGVVVTIVITRVYKPYYMQDVLSVGGEIQKNLSAFTDAATQSAWTTWSSYPARSSAVRPSSASRASRARRR